MFAQIINMKKTSFLLILSLLVALSSFPILARATATTEYSNSEFYPIEFTSLPKAFNTSYIFFSTGFMNETKYFAIGDVSNATSNLTAIYRFDSFGSYEDYDYYNFSENGTRMIYGNDINLFGWTSSEVIVVPTVDFYNGTVYLLAINLTKYAEDEDPFTVYNTGLTASTASKQGETSISTFMTAGAYIEGIVEIGNFTLGIAYYDGSNHYIAWDFYDPSIDNFDLADIKTLDWDTGLTDITKVYLLSSEGNCFYYDDCIFHIVFEGKSSQNSDREGIYVREIRESDVFGYDFRDKGLIGYTSPTGFEVETEGISYWTMSNSYPFLVRKIYQQVIQGSGRYYVYDYFDVDWSRQAYSVGLNHGSGNNTAFQYNAQNFTNIYDISNVTYKKYFTTNITSVDLKQTEYAYLIIQNYLYCDYDSTPHEPDDPNWIQSENYVKVTDAYNSSITQTYYLRGNSLSCTSGDTTRTEKLFVRVPLFSGSTTYNITVNSSNQGGWLPNGYSNTLQKVYLDVLDDVTTLGWKENPLFFVTEDNQGEVDSYNFYQYNYTYSTVYGDFNTSAFGIQTVRFACVCNEWSESVYYNTTHYYKTRSCIPSGCNDEFWWIYNTTSGGEDILTPDWEEGVNDTYKNPLLPGFLVSDDTALGKLVNSVNSALFFYTAVLIGLGGFVSFKFGGNHKGVVFIIILLLGVLLGAYWQIYPLWIPIILGVIGVYFVVRFALGMYKGGG